MRQTWTIVLAAGLLGACVPNSKDGGEVGETEASSGPGSASGSGATSDASDSDASMTGATTEPPVAETGSTGDVGETDETGSTTGGVPAECVERGWDTSFAAWQAAVEAGGGRYSYVAPTFTIQNFADIACEYATTVSVDNGVVVERSLVLIEDFSEGQCEPGFEETADNIGENGSYPAVAPLLLDQVYLDCCNNHLTVPEEDYSISFDVDENGMMSDCGAVDINCGEGCGLQEPGSIRISAHTFG